MTEKILMDICNCVGYLEGLFTRKENAKSDIEKRMWEDKIERAFKRQEELLAIYDILTIEITE